MRELKLNVFGFSLLAAIAAPAMAVAADFEVDFSALDAVAHSYPSQGEVRRGSEPSAPGVASAVKVEVPRDPATGYPVPVRAEPQFPAYAVKPKPVVSKPAAPKLAPAIEEPVMEAPAVDAVDSYKDIRESEARPTDIFPALPEAKPADASVAEPLERMDTDSVGEFEPAAPLVLAPVPAEQADKPDPLIRFASGTAPLSDANKRHIDEVLKTFGDASFGSLSILSYNYAGGGADDFKSKRQALDRAVEVRAYLLAKGYRNFNNIKVVGTSDPAKKDAVEIRG